MGQENRRSPRFPFIAVAEITHTDSGEKLDSRVAELSLNGCYVDMLNTLPVGSEVVIKIFAESECFEATARVIYAHPNLGMGLAFEQVSLKSGQLLRQWLLKASDAAK
jgi:PilZ domain